MATASAGEPWLGETPKLWWHQILNGYYRMYVYHALVESGVAEALRRAGESGATLADLAGELDLDTRTLEAALDYASLADLIIDKRERRYHLTERGAWLLDDKVHGALISQVEGYGCVYSELLPALRKQKHYGVDFERRAGAMARASFLAARDSYPWAARTLADRGVEVVADLGCGAGEILITFCGLDTRLRGVGIDISHEALAVARKRAVEQGLGNRIRFVQADITRLAELPPQTLAGVHAFTAFGVLHEFLRDGEPAVEAILTSMKARFAGCYLLVIETNAPDETGYRRMPIPDRIRLLGHHKLQHTLSLQGLPMARDRWVDLFDRAGVELVHDDAAAMFQRYLLRF